jgi:hypothetical protein
MKKLMTAALGVGLTVAMAGCANSAPEPTRPNGTYEQVRHNLGGDDLGKLAVGQTMSLNVRDGEVVKLYNLTKQPVDEQAFKRMVGYFASLSSKPGTNTFPIYPNGADNSVRVSPTVLDRTVTEHDFVLIPGSTPLPPAVGGTDAVTLNLHEQLQEISVVPQKDGKKFEATNGLAVETCQSMVEVIIASETVNDDRLTAAVKERLAQETFCNSMGEAATEVVSGASYDEYTHAVAADAGGSVSFGGNTYDVTYSTLTPAQYTGMQHALLDS